MNYFYRVRLIDGIVPYLLKSEVVEEDLSIWSNIELVWMESQLIFTALLLRRQSSVFLDHGLGWNRKDNVSGKGKTPASTSTAYPHSSKKEKPPSTSITAYSRSSKKDTAVLFLLECESLWTIRNIAGGKEHNFSAKCVLPLPPLISPFWLHDKRNQWATFISVFDLKECNRVNLYFFMNYLVRLMDGIVPYLLKSEVVEEDLSIWSNIELVWMESQMNFSALLLRQQSSVSLDHGLGRSRKDNPRKKTF